MVGAKGFEPLAFCSEETDALPGCATPRAITSHDIRLAYSNYLVSEDTVDIYTNITSHKTVQLYFRCFLTGLN